MEDLVACVVLKGTVETVCLEFYSKLVRTLSVPMQLGPLHRQFVPHNLISKSWEPCSFTEVPGGPQTLTPNFLWVQGKGAQIRVSE
jgi:hypothetical protein